MRLRQDDIEANEVRQRRETPAPTGPSGSGSALPAESERTISNTEVPLPAPESARGVAQRTGNSGGNEAERTLGGNDLVAESYLELALLAAQPVCRVTVRGTNGRFEGHATGFLIAPHVILTNWHVFRSRDEALNSYVEFDYRQDVSGKEIPGHRFLLRAKTFFLNDQELDYAVVAVAPISEDGRTPLSRYGYHRLGRDIDTGRWMTIIQHPSGQPRQFAIRENESMAAPDGLGDPRFVWYKSDTAQGSSGAPVFNDAFRVVALHHYGRARRQEGKYVLRSGRLVDSLDGVEDTEVDWLSNEGVAVTELVAHLRASLLASAQLGVSDHGRELLAALDGEGDIITRARNGDLERAHESASIDSAPPREDGITGVQVSIGHVSVAQMFVGGQPTIASPPQPIPVLPAPQPILPPVDRQSEVTKPPVLDNRYSNRKGYRESFLGEGFEVPLPKVLDRKLVSKMDDGEYEIPYQHFTVVMNRHRRLAIYCASNIDYRSAAHPQGDDYTRKVLGGYAEDDREEWVTDPRIPEQHQLPDRFYNRDRQAFDKGHIVRREDVCFGRTYAVIQRANGDTYHVTNCSPQVKGFNQSARGGIWGKLENLVQRESSRERYCVFAGPVFDPDDPVFEGTDKRGPVQIQIPQAFWKMVVARAGDALAAYAFRVEQDLSDVKFTEAEFAVTAAWRESMISVRELGEQVGLEFADVIVAADQYDEIVEGEPESTRRPLAD